MLQNHHLAQAVTSIIQFQLFIEVFSTFYVNLFFLVFLGIQLHQQLEGFRDF